MGKSTLLLRCEAIFTRQIGTCSNSCPFPAYTGIVAYDEMKLKHLESALSSVQGFSNPIWSLEQYLTPPHLASSFIYKVHSLDDIEGCSILDLGCGTGMLLIGAMLMGAESAIGVDGDMYALLLAKENLGSMELDEEAIDLIQGDVIQPLPLMPGKSMS